MVPKLKQKFQSETDVPDVGKVPEITLKPRDGTLSYLLLRSSSLHLGLESNQCGDCDKTCLNENALKRHIRAYHDESNSHKCHLFPWRFFAASHLKKHLQIKHNNEPIPKELICSECGKTFSKMGNLKYHFRSVHLGEKFPCKQCGKEFTSKHTLDYHVKKVHKTNEDMPVSQCDICGKTYSRKIDMKAHKRYVHDGIIDHKCDLCGKAFPRSWKLKAHIDSFHYGVKNHKCKYCSFCFGTRQVLKVHLKAAHGVDLFSKKSKK